MRSTLIWLTAALCVVAPFSKIRAQVPRGAEALSDQAIADTQAVIAQLSAHLKSNSRDGASWTRMGLAAWVLYERAKTPGSRKLDVTRLARMADTSLRIAAELQPDNAIAQLTIGDFLIASGATTSRTAAIGYYRAALLAARAARIDSIHSRAAWSLGMTAWRRYEPLANRRLSTNITDIGRSLTEAMQPIARAAESLEGASASTLAADTRALLAKTRGDPKSIQNDALSDPGRSAPGRAVSLTSVWNVIETQSMPLPANVTGAGELARADSCSTRHIRHNPKLRPRFAPLRW